MIWKKQILIYFILSILLIFSACNKDSTSGPDGTAPDIPPLNTFLMNFDDFDTTTVFAKSGSSLTNPQTQLNWTYSSAVVFIWQTIIGVSLAVPTASFTAAFLKDRTPEFKNGEWVWEYDFNSLAGLYHAALHGKIVGDEVEWAMFISKQGVFTDFKWFTGVSKILTTEGTWTLYNSPQNSIPILFIEWHRNLQDLTYDIKYTNIVSSSDENGSYIFNGVTNDTTYDAFYNIYGKVADNLTQIVWHRANQNGRVKDAVHFGDSDWHCWDGNHDDMVCGN